MLLVQPGVKFFCEALLAPTLMKRLSGLMSFHPLDVALDFKARKLLDLGAGKINGLLLSSNVSWLFTFLEKITEFLSVF
jgi:hypothetical protein